MQTFTSNRRRRTLGSVLGLTPDQLPNPSHPSLDPGTGDIGPRASWGLNTNPSPPPMPGSGGSGGGGLMTWGLPSAPTKAYWYTAAVGPTTMPGGSQPPGIQTPADAAITTVTGGGNPMSPPTAVVPPASGGASNTPVSTEPTATIYPGASAGAILGDKKWLPWAIGGAIVTAVGAYLISR